jgi:ADP-ribose pyrophosphatase YjhB (NUDIX family)
MDQRISAGGIVMQGDKVLLVHHYRQNEYDFWVLPGGGIEGNEGILRAAEREVLEETGLTVQAERLAYFEDFIDEGKYVCKFWVVCQLRSGTLSLENREADEGYLQGAGFFSKEEVQGMNVFPEVLRGDFWEDLQEGFPIIKYLGYKDFGRSIGVR